MTASVYMVTPHAYPTIAWQLHISGYRIHQITHFDDRVRILAEKILNEKRKYFTL